jgi:chromosome transmission fidelity protein 18
VDGNFWFFPSPNATQQTRPDDSSYDDAPQMFTVRSTNGMRRYIRKKAIHTPKTFQQTIAERSITAPGEATKSYYGINIHQLIKDSGDILPASTANTNEPTLEILPSIENVQSAGSNGRTMMWTEKYRAKKFTDLVGEERTHRAVLRWLKGWDPTVFPGTSKPKVKSKLSEEQAEEKHHRKILLMTGPPGLGKTTLAHVCARQAGYEVVEINASDERSRDVVNGRIKDCVGTENVRGISTKTLNGTARKPGRPVCVVVDEVDGVVSGSSGGGEGGFIKALVDLVVLDQKNSNIPGPSTSLKKPKKGDRFRMLRPIILICNDVYHPALRPLRSSNLAEIIHIRKPPLDKVVARMRNIFDNEGIKSDTDSVRRLCEATWGVSNRRDGHANSANTGEGDIRGVLVVGEWAASKLRSNATSSNTVPVLTRQWVEKNLLDDLCHGGGARGIGRGGAKEASDRVFLEGAGFPKSATTPLEGKKMSAGLTTTVGVADLNKYHAMNRLREVIDTAGEPDRILTDVFTAYPSQPFQDDNFLTKPNIAYEWLHFHDTLSSKVFSGQEWELSPYLSQSILGFHYLFSSAKRPWAGNNEQKFRGEEEEEPLPFSGPRANYSAFEAQKQNRAVLLGLQSSLSTNLLRAFRSAEDIATDLMPYLIRMLAPEVKPVIVGGSGESRGTASVRKEGERDMVRRAVEAMGAVGVTFERSRVEDPRGGYGGYVYRMEP